MENPKIVLYKEREFGEVFNVTFAFIKQEFRPLGRAILVFILPFILIQGILGAIIQTSMMGSLKTFNILTDGIGAFYLNMIRQIWPLWILLLVVYTMIFSTIASYLKLYNQSDEEITIAALGNEIKKCFFPVLAGSILTGIVVMVGFVFCIIPGIYLGVSLSVFLIAMVIEQRGIGDAFSRSFQLVQIQWWWTFLLLFVTVIMMYIVTLVFQVPAMIIGFGSVFHNLQTHTNPMEVFGPVYIIYTSVISAIQQLLYIVPIFFVAFQYFNLVEIRDKNSLNQKINAIGQNE
jgi:hypothetical protein